MQFNESIQVDVDRWPGTCKARRRTGL